MGTVKFSIPQKLSQCHSQVISLLESSRDRLLSFSPPRASTDLARSTSDALTVLSDISNLISITTEFSNLLLKVRTPGVLAAAKNQVTDLSSSDEFYTINEWENELDRKGVELWNHAGRLKRQIEAENHLNPPASDSRSTYYKALDSLHHNNLPNAKSLKRKRPIEGNDHLKVYAASEAQVLLLSFL